MTDLNLEKIAEEFREKHNFPEGMPLHEVFSTDPETVNVLIKCVFPSPIIYKSFKFDIDISTISVEQENTVIVAKINRPISKKLFNCLNELNNNSFLIGYLYKILPEINKQLQEQKYLNGYILGNSYSLFDILFMSVTDSASNKEVQINLIKSIATFPPSHSLAKDHNHIFIRDLIDAITYYFSYNFDEAVRKTITSLENFFHQTNTNADTFKKKLEKCFIKENYPSNWDNYFHIFKRNIGIIYKIRNGIVHDKLRLNNEHSLICRKGIFTVFYIYRGAQNDAETRRFVYTINMQTELIEQMIRGTNLDELNKIFDQKPTGAPINSMEDLDHFYFTGMRITNDEEKSLPKV